MATMALPFTTLDVFTETRFHGNPLAVVTIPPGIVLTQAQKQAIAREFNLSETTFVHDLDVEASAPTDKDKDTRRFDIFTPYAEIPFAGHPTIGTAALLYSTGVRTLLAKAGPISIERVRDGSLRAAIPHNTRLHEKRVPSPGRSPTPTPIPALQDTVARAEHGAPLFSIVKGMTFALIELPSLEALGAVTVGSRPDLPADLLDAGWRDGWVTRRYYFVRLGCGSVDGRNVHRIRTRMVKLAMEDPATGSAACALAGYLGLYALQERSAAFEITQGVEMGRGSTLLVDVDVEADEGSAGARKLGALHLGGKAVPVMSGSIAVPL
ncbi:Diaminopimelate epimerase-like protein [Aspergillus carlsbadensis]|nr:Diaminopimelate epimerase-like protein [Aspergillus carlsbadensis]